MAEKEKNIFWKNNLLSFLHGQEGKYNYKKGCKKYSNIKYFDKKSICSGLSPRGALKKRRRSWLDVWIFPAFCSGMALFRALKTRRCSGLDVWIFPAFCSGLALCRALRKGGVPDWTHGLSPHSVLVVQNIVHTGWPSLDDQEEAFQVWVIPRIFNFEVALQLIYTITVFVTIKY